jgi:hypothetical protein
MTDPGAGDPAPPAGLDQGDADMIGQMPAPRTALARETERDLLDL